MFFRDRQIGEKTKKQNYQWYLHWHGCFEVAQMIDLREKSVTAS